jgi:iron complex outermembrane receptor protein
MPFETLRASKRCLLSLLFLLFVIDKTLSQEEDTLLSAPLETVHVRAFEGGRRLADLPASVHVVGRTALEAFGSASVVQAVNTTPGVRMEERSPGSYRFNIRGSSLRSTFGVRNVKVYYNDLPLTDPGGHTYLNQLGYYNFNSLEIIKGPGSSLYGAGTGGVLLIEGRDASEAAGVFTEYARGSYGLQNIYGSVSTGKEQSISKFGFQHQQSDGYRAHSELKRDVLSWTGNFRLNGDRQIKTTFLYSDLFYETPGALNRTEFEADPKLARPGGFGVPSSEAAGAAIYQKMFLAGASLTQPILPQFENKTTVYGAFTELKNPNLRGFDKSSEPHAGGRTAFTWKPSLNNSVVSLTGGAEWQQGFTTVGSYKNRGGQPDSLRYNDEIRNRQSFVFFQALADIGNHWTFMGGASWNWLRVRFQRFNPATPGMQVRTFNNEIAPRLSLAYKLSHLTLYTGVARGFSPPTTAELLPTGGSINIGLNPESGINYDAGARLSLPSGLYADMNIFLFRLQNTIVQRRDVAAGDFFVNAGKTNQKGVETYISHPLLSNAQRVQKSLGWISHTWHHFRYKEFRQQTSDFSGNALPGVAPHTVSAGFDVHMNSGLLATATLFYSDRIPLTDANTDYAESYSLIGLKVGYQKWIRNQWRIKTFIGVDNLLDERYSLGNDINGFGGRYYNPAAGRNYYGALVVQWSKNSPQNVTAF